MCQNQTSQRICGRKNEIYFNLLSHVMYQNQCSNIVPRLHFIVGLMSKPSSRHRHDSSHFLESALQGVASWSQCPQCIQCCSTTNLPHQPPQIVDLADDSQPIIIALSSMLNKSIFLILPHYRLLPCLSEMIFTQTLVIPVSIIFATFFPRCYFVRQLSNTRESVG